VEGIMIVCSVVILVAAENIVRIFSVEAGLVEFAGAFLRIAVTGYIVLGFVAVLMNTLSGSGDTVPPMVVGMATVCLVTLPLAYILPRFTTLGVYGVRWAMVADLVIPAFVFIIYFRRGRWKSKII
jgi:Na+-driven multidrug efflux pump